MNTNTGEIYKAIPLAQRDGDLAAIERQNLIAAEFKEYKECHKHSFHRAALVALSLMVASPAYANCNKIITGQYGEREVEVNYINGSCDPDADAEVKLREIPCGTLYSGIDCGNEEDTERVMKLLIEKGVISEDYNNGE